MELVYSGRNCPGQCDLVEKASGGRSHLKKRPLWWRVQHSHSLSLFSQSPSPPISQKELHEEDIFSKNSVFLPLHLQANLQTGCVH